MEMGDEWGRGRCCSGDLGLKGRWAGPRSSGRAGRGCCVWQAGHCVREQLISISSCESSVPLYLKQTPAIMPQQAGIVILSGC